MSGRCVPASIRLVAIIALMNVAGAADQPKSWHQFLGPNRNGISSETGLISKWPKAGLPEVWRVRGGVGMSGLAIADGRVVTLVQRGDTQLVVAYAVDSGDELWARPIAGAFDNPQGAGPRATPCLIDGRAFVFTGQGVLAAIDVEDGTIAWKEDTLADRGRIADYGMASSPLAVGENILVTVGVRDATVAAFNRKTGKLAWTAGKDAPAGYSSPTILTIGKTRQVVAFHGLGAIGIAADSGRVLWEHPYETDFDCNIATPLAIGGDLFLSAGENHGCTRLKLTPSGDSFQIDEVWSSKGPRSVLRNEWQTSILFDGYLYGFDNVGSAGPVTHLTCVNAETGERAWRKTRFGKGNLIAAEGKLFVTTMKGELVVVRATPDEYDEIGRAKVIERTRQAPALSGGHLFLRDGRQIVCLNAKK